MDTTTDSQPPQSAPPSGSVSLPRVPQCHRLKCWPEFYAAVVGGWKPFEARKNDRDFKFGDILILEEWDPETRLYTGERCQRQVTYILRGPAFGVEAGWVVLGLATLNRVLNEPSSDK